MFLKIGVAMKKRIVWKFLAFVALMLVGADVFAQSNCATLTADGTGLFDTVVTNFHNGTSIWLTNAQKYASDLFLGLGGIELSWSAVTWVLRKNSLGEYWASLFFKVMSISFFFMIISYAPTWIPLALNGAQQVAVGITQGSGSATIPTVSGLSGMISPSAVLDSGVCVAGALANNAVKGLGSGLGNAVLFAFIMAFALLVVGISYFIIVLQLVMTEIEAFIVLFGGLIMLGALGSRWTTSWGEKYIGYAVSVGVKLLVIYLIISLGNSVTANSITKAVGGTDVITLTSLIGFIMTCLVYAGLVWNIPSLAGSFLNGSPNMSMGTMAGAGMAAVGAAAGLAAGAAGATLKGVGSMSNAGGGGSWSGGGDTGSGMGGSGGGGGMGGGSAGGGYGGDGGAAVNKLGQDAYKRESARSAQTEAMRQERMAASRPNSSGSSGSAAPSGSKGVGPTTAAASDSGAGSASATAASGSASAGSSGDDGAGSAQTAEGSTAGGFSAPTAAPESFSTPGTGSGSSGSGSGSAGATTASDSANAGSSGGGSAGSAQTAGGSSTAGGLSAPTAAPESFSMPGTGSGGSGSENAFTDPNSGSAASTGSSSDASTASSSLSSTADQLLKFSKNRLGNAAQHLKSSDGTTGSVSGGVIKHTD
jgi:type IV secretion system protein TrbL